MKKEDPRIIQKGWDAYGKISALRKRARELGEPDILPATTILLIGFIVATLTIVAFSGG